MVGDPDIYSKQLYIFKMLKSVDLTLCVQQEIIDVHCYSWVGNVWNR